MSEWGRDATIAMSVYAFLHFANHQPLADLPPWLLVVASFAIVLGWVLRVLFAPRRFE
jgi:hypothetical protein